MKAWARVALWGVVALGLLGAVRLFADNLGDATLGENGGIHAALASDLLVGELYRPVMDERGYGGTRYMPGFFMLYAAALRLGKDVVFCGIALEQITVFFLVGVTYWALRRLEVGRAWALPLSALILCTFTWTRAAFDPRADYLSSALVVAAFVLTLDGWAALAAFAVVVAVFVKITSGLFLVVPLVALLREGRRREALTVAAASLGACALGVAALDGASGGRFVEGLAATWTAGTPPWRPLLCVSDLVNDEVCIDPVMGLALATAVIGAVRFGMQRGLLGVFCAAALAEALVTHMSRGTGTNHLIVLHVACILVMGRLVVAGRTSLVGAAMLATLGVLAVCCGPVALPRRSVQLALVADLPQGARLLSDNPVLPLLRGERPFLLDAYNLRWMVEQGTAVGRDFEARVRAHQFEAIVLTDVERAGANHFFEETFPAWRRLRDDYQVEGYSIPWVRLYPMSPLVSR